MKVILVYTLKPTYRRFYIFEDQIRTTESTFNPQKPQNMQKLIYTDLNLKIIIDVIIHRTIPTTFTYGSIISHQIRLLKDF